MLLTKLQFVLWFLPLLTLVAARIPNRWKSLVLTLGGLAFCAFTGWKTLLLAVISVLGGWFAVRCCPRTCSPKAKAWIGISLCIQTIVLCLGNGALPLLCCAVQAILCIFDRARGKMRIPSLPQYVVYTCEFPRLFGCYPLAYSEHRDMQEMRRFDLELLGKGLCRMVLGVFLVNVLAVPMLHCYHMIADAQIGTLRTLPDAWLCAFAVFCAANFTLHGCMEVGHGMAMVLGYDLPDGYDAPTTATTLSDYGKRFWMPLYDCACRILQLPQNQAPMPLGNWCWRVLCITCFLGLLFAGSIPAGLCWGAVVTLLLLAERYLPQKWILRIPAPVRMVCVNLFAIGLGGALLGADPSSKFGDALTLLGKGGLLLSDTAKYAVSWYWGILLLGLLSLLPIRKWLASLAQRYSILQTIGIGAIPLASLGMLMLSVMQLL